ncbi:TPM domain-containing protein [Bifidobacterium sp. W8130]|nr:TPM domain-containing protein [Bifidobacterium asteroides]
MTVFTQLPLPRTHVVERIPLHKTSPLSLSAMRRVLALLLSMVLAVGALGPTRGYADEPQTDAGTMTDTITDPQNLLGSDVGSVKDAIKETAEETGVSVRLLYLPHFYAGVKPETWASRVLESMKPAHDTVLLAVASQDGKLVVAVSSNSQAWLKDQSSVDQLSQAALEPVTKGRNPDWVGSAKAMMTQVETLKQNQRHHRVMIIALSVTAVILVILVVAVAIWWRRSSRTGAHDRKSNIRKSSAAKKEALPTKTVSELSDNTQKEAAS